AAELDLTYARSLERKSRLYVVAIGTDLAAAKQVHALTAHFERRGKALFERVDVISLLDREATKSIIRDTLGDVAELTRPQDVLVVLLRGAGTQAGDKLNFLAHGSKDGDGALALDDIAGAIGTAKALKR